MNHNKRGEIATLLTLGLVIIGTIITLATSLFVNNQKTNLASNSKAETQCVFGDWDCATKDCNGQAGCICGKMGKGSCSPGNCQAENRATGDIGDVCVPNKWNGMGGWGCWGPAIGPADGNICAPQASPSPVPGVPPGGTQNCTPGSGSFGNDGKYYCCFKAYGGPVTKLSYPHYEVMPSPPATNCAEAAGTKAPANCGQGGYYETNCKNQNPCMSNTGVKNWTCQDNWCCQSSATVPTMGATATPAPGKRGGVCTPYYGYSGCDPSLTCNTTDNICVKYIAPSPVTTTATTLNCTDTNKDYNIYADSGACGGDDKSCQLNQKKFKKASSNKCKGDDSKCIVDQNCPDNQLAAGTATPIPVNSIPMPILNPSTSCTNQECADPNLTVWYSYKCASVPQILGGVTQCPSFDFFRGKDCKDLFSASSSNFDNLKQNFCSASYISLYAKRDVLVTYTLDQTGVLNIDPSNPTGTFVITNNFNLNLFTKSFTIGKDTFPINDTITVNTGSNVIHAYFSYPNRTSITATLPSAPAEVVNGKADISIDIK